MRFDRFGSLGAVHSANGRTPRNVEQFADGNYSTFLHFDLGSDHARAGVAASAGGA